MRKGFIYLISMLSMLGVVLLFSPVNTAQAIDQYRRWLDDGKAFVCTDTGSQINVTLNQQNVEFGNLPANAQFYINYIKNGVTTTDGPYTVEQTTGTLNYASFTTSFAAYPLTFEFRLDTYVNGSLVYQSSLIASCSGDDAFLVTPVNVDLNTDAYRRWLDNGKVFTCQDTGALITVTLNNQDVEFNNLPVDAQFTINYIKNGVITTDGPYTVEQTSGTRNYASFQTTFPSYPLTFEFRLDTFINGVLVYQSSLIVSCSADTTVPVTPVNGLPGSGGGGGASAQTCVAPIPSGSVQGRMLETLNGLYAPDAGATTNVVLPIGTSWWIIDAENGYYQLWIACLADPLWVPASAMGANYDSGGAALPNAG